MSLFDTPLVVTMADGTEHHVTSDQRDLARWEASPSYTDNGFHTRARFVGWSALQREGIVSATWAEFNTKLCLEVVNDPAADVDGDDPDGEGEQGLDPGQRATSDTASSTSQSSAGNPSPARAGSRRGTRATSTRSGTSTT